MAIVIRWLLLLLDVLATIYFFVDQKRSIGIVVIVAVVVVV